MEELGGWKRSCYCAELGKKDAGQKVCLMGWVNSYRDHGGVVFIDLRDRTGLVQVVFNPSFEPATHEKAGMLRNEWVVAVQGEVRARPADGINPKLKTGEIEVWARELKILNRALATPFAIEDEIKSSEEVRLKYRYLDLRRPEMQKKLITRHKVVKMVRDYFDQHGFFEIETPFLTKSTPEGARDYLVPSRINPGKFYALPQSPQLFKQILMVAGYDRYFQVVRCMRDEDLRADRQPEFTQVDVEMSFAQPEDVYELIEGLLSLIWKQVLGVELARPFPRMTWDQAMADYGTDRPDTRFGLLLKDLTDIFPDSEYRFFKQAVSEGGIIKGMVAPGAAGWSRKDTDDLTHALKAYGAKGLTVMRFQEDGLAGPVVKYLKADEQKKMIERLGAKIGDLLMLMADKFAIANEGMNQLRQMVARKMNLVPENKYNFLWVVDFPLLEWSETDQRWKSTHHPFTMPKAEDLDKLESEPGKVKARAYDVVLNGVEIGGGSIRIHRPDIQEKIFRVLGIDEAEAKLKFGFLLDAFKFGAPPHGGIALGLDRLMQLLVGGNSIRDVIPFPKTQAGADLMCDAPSEVSEDQLKELRLNILKDDLS
jgi:aspartyl-tRNA synthetase